MSWVSPLHDLHVARGAVVVLQDGVEVARHFGDPAGEVRTVRTGTGVIDRADQGTLVCTGVATRKLLHGQVTNDVLGLAPGQGCYAAHLSPKGRMVTDLVLRCEAPDRLVITLMRPLATVLAEKLAMHAMLDDCALVDVTEERAAVLVAGPESRERLESLGAAGLPTTPYHHAAATCGGVPVVATARPDTGEVAFELSCARADVTRLVEALLDAGVALVGSEAFDLLRIEAGTPVWGRDMTDQNLPPECGIPHAVSYTKGCYVGQETIARLKTYGEVNKRLVGLASDVLLPAGALLLDADGKDAGQVTSSGLSPTLGDPIAIGYARRGRYEAGATLVAQVGGRGIPVEIVELPWVERRFAPA